MSERIVITNADRHSATWDKLQLYWTQQLADLRAQNDHDLSEKETALLRGRIRQIKAFMSLDTQAPVFTAE